MHVAPYHVLVRLDRAGGACTVVLADLPRPSGELDLGRFASGGKSLFLESDGTIYRLDEEK